MKDLEEYVKEMKAALRKKARNWDRSTVDRVAEDLERYGYDPGIFFPVPDFASYSAEEMGEQLDSILAMDEEEVEGLAIAEDRSAAEVKRIAVDMLIGQFYLLERLRAGEPEAWDEIHELYEDD
jgi:hypothetical protein